jgi:hypothetical protein
MLLNCMISMTIIGAPEKLLECHALSGHCFHPRTNCAPLQVYQITIESHEEETTLITRHTSRQQESRFSERVWIALYIMTYWPERGPHGGEEMRTPAREVPRGQRRRQTTNHPCLYTQKSVSMNAVEESRDLRHLPDTRPF